MTPVVHFRAETERGLSRKHIIEGATQFEYFCTFAFTYVLCRDMENIVRLVCSLSYCGWLSRNFVRRTGGAREPEFRGRVVGAY